MEILAQSSANFALTLLFGHPYIMGASRGGPCDSTALVRPRAEMPLSAAPLQKLRNTTNTVVCVVRMYCRYCGCAGCCNVVASQFTRISSCHSLFALFCLSSTLNLSSLTDNSPTATSYVLCFRHQHTVH